MAVKNVLSSTVGASRQFALAPLRQRKKTWTAAALGCVLLVLMAQAASVCQEPQKNEPPQYTVKINVPVVTLEVSVLTRDGLFVPGLGKENFRILEDGETQTVTSMGLIEAPITVVLLIEHTADITPMQQGTLMAAYSFLKTLKKEDWAALVLFDKHSHIRADFTQDKAAIRRTLTEVGIALSREISLFDALYDTLDRLEHVEGRKFVILMSSGADTLSHKTLDDVLQKIQFSRETVIYSLDTIAAVLNRQGANELRTFADLTGGKLYFPVSSDDYADVFQDIARLIRNQYSLSYNSSHKLADGSWHKIKVEVVNADGSQPKYQIIAREGYRAKKQVQ